MRAADRSRRARERVGKEAAQAPREIAFHEQLGAEGAAEGPRVLRYRGIGAAEPADREHVGSVEKDISEKDSASR